MKLLNIWQGFRLSSMSPWYHAASFFTGLMLYTDQTQADQRSLNQPASRGDDSSSSTMPTVYETYTICMWVHFSMCIFAMIQSLLNMKGRHNNKIRNTLERPNAWIQLAQYLDTITNIFYLCYIVGLTFIMQFEQMCTYFYNTQESICGANYYKTISCQLVYILYTQSAYLAYVFGITLYISTQQIIKAFRNTRITDAQKQFTDFLVLRQKEARWCGFQFLMIYTNIIAIYFSERYQIKQEFNSNMWSRVGVLYLLLAIQIVKNILFQPLTKVVNTETFEDKIASSLAQDYTQVTEENDDKFESSQEMVISDNSTDNKEKEETNQEGANNCGINATPELQEAGPINIHQVKVDQNVINQAPVEVDEDEVFYELKHYRLRMRRWFAWPILIGAEIAVIFYWFMTNLETYQYEYYNYTFVLYYIFSSFFMVSQYVKCWMFERYKHRFPYIQGHERAIIDNAWLKKTPLELTKESQEMYSKLEGGANINIVAFKTLSYSVRKKMDYPLEIILQAQFIFMFTWVIQFVLVTITLSDFYSAPQFDVVIPSELIVVLSRIFCAMIMHLQTEPYVRFGLNMWKYAVNHPEEFHTPGVAAIIGFMYAKITMLIAISCIFKICSVTSVISTLSSYVAYTAISFLPNFVFLSLPMGHPLKTGMPDLIVKNRRRNIESRKPMFWCLRGSYKVLRIFYCSFWFYFLPLVPMVLPFLTTNVPAHNSFLKELGQN